MRKKNFKGRCEKRKLRKCENVCRTYDAIQYAYAELLNNTSDIKSFRVNVLLDGMEGGYTSDFVCTKTDNDLMVRECVERKHLTKPLTVKLLQASREFWLRHGVSEWGLSLRKRVWRMNKECLKKNMLLKKEKGETVAKGNVVYAGKNDILENEMADTDTTGNVAFGETMEVNADTVQLFRVLAVEDEKVLVIDCIKKIMPVWVET